MEIRSAALVGLGAVGAFVATRLRDTLGAEFAVVAGGARRARLENGVLINGTREHFTLRSPGEGAPADLVIFATKNMQLPQAMEDAAACIGEGTVLLSLLNGIDSEEKLTARFPQAHTLRCLIKVPATNQNGAITLPLDTGRILFGEDRNETLSPQTAAVDALFTQAGIPHQIPADMVRAQWLKYMANVSENQTAAVLGLCYGDFQRSEHARQLCRQVSREVIAVARACGVDLSEADDADRERYLLTLRPEGKPSTLQDLEAGRPTEVETFSGRMIALGEAHGVDTPLCRWLYHAIRALEEKN